MGPHRKASIMPLRVAGEPHDSTIGAGLDGVDLAAAQALMGQSREGALQHVTQCAAVDSEPMDIIAGTDRRELRDTFEQCDRMCLAREQRRGGKPAVPAPITAMRCGINSAGAV
jgi:hypothetical protein